MTIATKVNPNHVCQNDLMAFIYFARVEKNDRGETLKVYDLDNQKEM